MDTNKFVGEKIKFFREEQNLSLADLAEKTGLAVEQIERIENNTDIPSLAPLIKIAKALGTRIGTFLDDQTENGPVICRKEEAKETISFSNNSVNSRRHMHYQSLSRSKANRHMEPFIIEIEPNNGDNDVDFILSSHEGEEFIIVMEGIIEISYGKQKLILEEGDSIYYDSIVPHHVHSYEGKPAKILAVVYTPL
ncbi:MAG: helix-turn-helix domain-containing protein [Bacteroidales bacterium]|nr:helix-turn-helix domain-containing protein [Bacteroidales bacterium]